MAPSATYVDRKRGQAVTRPMTSILSAVDDGFITTPRPELAPLVNWGGGGGMPIHRWFHYREGFSPTLISELELGERILDPFCGSGSIMVGAAQQCRQSVGIDVNPLAAFVARVKLSPLPVNATDSLGSFAERFERSVGSAERWPLPELGIATKVFEPDVLDTLLRLRTLIEHHGGGPEERDFLLLAWLSILQEVGSYFKEGNGIKYRNRKRLKTGYVARTEGEWQLQRFGSDQASFVRTAFKSKLNEMVADSKVWSSGDWSAQRIIEGNSLTEAMQLSEGSFDSVIFSPPYANRFDYFESQKVELWFGGFVSSYDDMIALRKRSVRSHLGAALDNEAALLPEIEDLIDLIDPSSYAVQMRVPSLIRGYFSDMAEILRASRRALKPGGRCSIVVGNSAYGGVIIPTDSLIARLGLQAGFETAAVVPVRHLTVAPQQRSALRSSTEYMRESVVVLS
jgi:SAM-dependent methyltransferase